MKIKAGTASLIIALAIYAMPAWSLSLEEAKQQGLVGETSSGYLAARDNSSAASSLVKSINAERKKHYAEISKRNGTALSTVEQLAGEKLINKTPQGQYYHYDGTWHQR